MDLKVISVAILCIFSKLGLVEAASRMQADILEMT